MGKEQQALGVYKGKNVVLITGASSSLAPYIIVKLITEGYTVIGIDIKLPLSEWDYVWTDSYHHHMLDLLTTNKLRDLINKFEVSCIIHLATSRNYRQKFDTNLLMTNKVLQAMVGTNCKKIIFTSSLHVYGLTRIGKENFTRESVCDYGRSNLATETLIQYFCSNDGIEARILRLADVGGIKDYNGNNALTKSITQLLQKGFITINSNNYKTFDGTCTRNYIHISDVCKLMKKIFRDWSKSQGTCQIYDVGGKDTISTLNLVKVILGSYPNYVHSGQGGLYIGQIKNPSCPILIPHLAKINLVYKWQPTKNLKKIITDTITESL